MYQNEFIPSFLVIINLIKPIRLTYHYYLYNCKLSDCSFFKYSSSSSSSSGIPVAPTWSLGHS
jgi:hypothetical protein